MATQTTPFQGTKFRMATGVETAKNITACNLKPATITVAQSGYKPGDAITLTGLGVLDGTYPVKSVASDVITLADEVDWSERDRPTNFADAKAAKVLWSEQFCAIKNIEKSDDSLSTVDITTVCSEGTETEPGEIEYGSIKLSFFYAPSTEMQQRLRKAFHAKETFPFKLELTKGQGTVFGRGFIESGNGFSGEVKGKFDGSVSIKPAGRDYLLPA